MTDTMPSTTGREPRPEKVAIVDEVKERLQRSSAALLTEYRGLRVSELSTLRAALTTAGGDLKVYKNTLVRFAVRDLDLDIDEAMLTGPTAIAFVDGDAASVAKALRDFARTNPNLVVKGGILGDAALSADEARALADLPSRDVLLARLAGGLAAPLVGFAGLLQALPRNFAYGLKALIDQGGAPGAPAAESAAAPAATSDEGAAADTTADPAPAEGAAADVPADAAPADTAPAADAAPAVEATADAVPAADEALGEGAPPAEAPAAAVADDAPDAAPVAVPVEGAPVGASTDDPAEPAPAAEATTDAVPAEEAATTEAASAAASETEAAPAAASETEAAPAAATDTEGEAAPAETTDTPEEAS